MLLAGTGYRVVRRVAIVRLSERESFFVLRQMPLWVWPTTIKSSGRITLVSQPSAVKRLRARIYYIGLIQTSLPWVYIIYHIHVAIGLAHH